MAGPALGARITSGGRRLGINWTVPRATRITSGGTTVGINWAAPFAKWIAPTESESGGQLRIKGQAPCRGSKRIQLEEREQTGDWETEYNQ